MIYVVIQKFNDDNYRYCGQPCMSEEEAREVMRDHADFDTNHFELTYCEGTVFYEGMTINNNHTGELFLIATMVG